MAKRKPKSISLSDQLRVIIETHEKSRYRISKETGIDASQLSRFVNGTGRITNDTLDKLGKCLDLEFRIKGEK